MKMTKSKWITSAVVLVVLVSIGRWLWKRHTSDDVQYQTVAVTRGDLTQLVTATGQLNPVTNVTVGCQISGTLSKIFVDYNSPVTNGQVVAQIDPSTYEANIQLAAADVANAKAALELAQINARRAKELLENKVIAQSDYDTAVANLHQAEATLVNKQAALNRSQVDLDRCTIFSPVDGIVISRSVDVGQTVAASLNAPTLFTIANDLAKMQIDANVAEADVGGVEVGQNVDFTVDAFPNRTFHGEVVQVRNSPITVQNVVTYDTVIGVNNPDLKLKPGMTANVSIIIAQRDDTLKIPNAALRYRPPDAASSNPGSSRGQGGGGQRPSGGGGGNWGGKKREHSPTRPVYVLGKDGKPQQAQIKVGITDGISSEVLDGLKEDDKVVTGSTSKQAGASQPQSPFSPGFRRF